VSDIRYERAIKVYDTLPGSCRVGELATVISGTTAKLYCCYATNVWTEIGPPADVANPVSIVAAGTAYSLTNTSAALDFGTTDPVLTIPAAGTWLIFATAQLDYNGATFAASRTVTLKLRRTNNTAADIASRTLKTQVITTLTFTMGVYPIAPQLYTTTNTDDSLSIFGDVSVVPTAGSLDAVAASIVAVKIT
jgi:hypothetical protein